MSVNIPQTFGALLTGGIVASFFSGLVTVQSFIYFKIYPKDILSVKFLVLIVWFLDFLHTIFVAVSIWIYLIHHFGDETNIDDIPWSLAITIAFTAVLTFLVHIFFVVRIYKLSGNNRYLASPLALLSCARLVFACLTTAKMITLKSFAKFKNDFTWSFTIGLSLSAALDVLITGSMFFLLKSKQKKNSSLNLILDTLMLYTFENGALTCLATVVSLICWLTMPRNLVFMGLHFVISKFYANSLLATLNARNSIRQKSRKSHPSSSSDRAIPFAFRDDVNLTRWHFSRQANGDFPNGDQQPSETKTQLQINVEKTTIHSIDEESPSPYTSHR